jgi:hypothetical protein
VAELDANKTKVKELGKIERTQMQVTNLAVAYFL